MASRWPLPLQPLHLRLRQEEGVVKGKEGAGRVSPGAPEPALLPTAVGSHGAVHPFGTSSLGASGARATGACPCVPEVTCWAPSQCIPQGPGSTPYLAPAAPSSHSPRGTPASVPISPPCRPRPPAVIGHGAGGRRAHSRA